MRTKNYLRNIIIIHVLTCFKQMNCVEKFHWFQKLFFSILYSYSKCDYQYWFNSRIHFLDRLQYKITSEKKQIWENTSLLIFSSSKLFNSRFFSLSFSDIHTHWVSLKVHYYLTILQWASCGFVRLKVHLKQYNGYEISSKGGNTAIVSGILHTAL